MAHKEAAIIELVCRIYRIFYKLKTLQLCYIDVYKSTLKVHFCMDNQKNGGITKEH